MRHPRPNHSTDPTLASATPPAGQELRPCERRLFHRHADRSPTMKANSKIISPWSRGRKDSSALRARLMTEARNRHAEAFKAASSWRRLWLRFVLEYEVWKAMSDPGPLRFRDEAR